MKIGVATIWYSKDGVPTRTRFIPEPEAKALNPKPELYKIQGDADALQHNAEVVLSSWFSKLSDIELADREAFKINSNILKCDKYTNGIVQKCIVELSLIPI